MAQENIPIRSPKLVRRPVPTRNPHADGDMPSIQARAHTVEGHLRFIFSELYPPLAAAERFRLSCEVRVLAGPWHDISVLAYGDELRRALYDILATFAREVDELEIRNPRLYIL